MSQNSYYPYLKVASEAHLSKDDMGQRLIFGDEHIICTNNSYLRRKNVGDEMFPLTSKMNDKFPLTQDINIGVSVHVENVILLKR